MLLMIFDFILIGGLIAAAVLHVITIADERVDALLAAGEGFVLSDEHVLMASPESSTAASITAWQRAITVLGRIARVRRAPSSVPELTTVSDFDTPQEQVEAAA